MTQDQLMNAVFPALMPILIALLTGLAAYAVRLIKRLFDQASVFLEAKMGESDYSLIRQIARDQVLQLEQNPALKELMSDEKKQYAITQITNYVDMAGMDFSREQISELIEAVLSEIKKDIPAGLPA